MRRSLVVTPCLLLLCGAIARSAEAPPVAVDSPDGRLRFELLVGADDPPRFRVAYRGRAVTLDSPLGVDLADGSSLGAGSTIEKVERRSFREAYDQFPGKRRRVEDRGSEIVVALRERAGPRRRWEVVARAYDDGAAFRYRFPAQEGWDRLEIAGERTGFRFPEGAKAHALPLASFTSSHEALYTHGPMADLKPGQLFGLPMLVELPGTGWVALAQANLTEYAGLYLTKADGPGASLATRLSPLPGEPKVAVRASLPHESPWRVLMVADKVERLVESDLILNLNAPRAFDDVSWIKPGKTTFPWWNGFHEEPGAAPFKMALNTATAKYYIDFCAEAGIPYHSLDGMDGVAWYGGPTDRYEGAGITKGVDGLDLPEVIAHAKSKGVKLRLWMHWGAAERHMEEAFPLYREWGIEGVMLDFMDRDDQEMARFLRKALKTAADNRLTVTLHGVGEPTGLERTFPNLLNSESIMNLEYDKWDPKGVPPDHEATAPFTRMLAGPLDFHQGTLRGVAAQDFVPRNAAPLVIGTPARMLATYVIFQNHLPMLADYPSAYRGNPELATLASIPCAWDDVRGLSGKVGEWAVIARRDGNDWWVGGLTNAQARELSVPLEFLGPETYHAEIHADGPDRKVARRTVEAIAKDVLKIQTEPAGGFLIRLRPQKTKDE